MKYLRVLSAVAATPWCIEPLKGEAMLAFLEFAAAGHKRTPEELAAIVPQAPVRAAEPGAGGSSGGVVAVLSIRGAIMPRIHDVEDISTGGGTSAEGFGRSFRAAARDPNVGAILIDVDSPGGCPFGVQEVVADMRAARGSKPIVAVAAPWAASAAYWLASAADELVVTPSGEVGSIGCYSYHESVAKMLEKAGVEPTLIKAGENKANTHPAFALSAEAKAYMQERVDATKRQFVADVALNRGVSPADVVAKFGDGKMIAADEAVRVGMADRIGTLDDEIARLVSEVRQSSGRSQRLALALS